MRQIVVTAVLGISALAGFQAAAAGSQPAAAPAVEAAVTAIVRGAETPQGQIIGSLFDSSESFMRQPLQRVAVDVDERGEAILQFGRHVTGQYAIVIVHDANSNDELDTGFLGIPKEKVGFSNNAKSRFGPAKWDDASFTLNATDLVVEIVLGRTDYKK